MTRESLGPEQVAERSHRIRDVHHAVAIRVPPQEELTRLANRERRIAELEEIIGRHVVHPDFDPDLGRGRRKRDIPIEGVHRSRRRIPDRKTERNGNPRSFDPLGRVVNVPALHIVGDEDQPGDLNGGFRHKNLAAIRRLKENV